MRSEEKSKSAFERALKTLVGGVNSPVRSFRRVGGTPLFMTKGEGAYLWDLDGNRYLDFVMSYGPHLLGHAHPYITEKVIAAVKKSPCLGFSSEDEILWAEEVASVFGKPLMVRAMSSGTEATMTAIRLARGITGRDLVLKFSGHYHGHVDSLLVDAGSGVATLSEAAVPECAGVPKALAALARVAPFNDSTAVQEIFRAEGAKIAAVIVEPIMGNMGVIPPAPGFLEVLRNLCTSHGSILILDEVMTGFRVHERSAQGLYAVEPDLSCFGKIVGGGMPLSALVGEAKFMKELAPLGPVYQAGTLSGNPASIAAGRAMLELLRKENPYGRLETLSARFQRTLETAARTHGVDVDVQRVGSMISVFFRKEKTKNAADARDVDLKRFNTYFRALLDEGILIPPSPFEAYFVSTAHAVALESAAFEESIDRVFKTVARS
ncbi:MAG TPA: glutamate-1-semialdehyde 2,1-aminomutase [Bdellovibrionota bacterium]|jgi:glutamate-1-semialdehyde 2,1-aminomutase|nr:glutamate-1-semialdehyde 2,1-aminomutase [Bdellovibrionota bacterium]